MYTLHTTCHQFSKSPPFLRTHSHVVILYYTQTCHSKLTDIIFHKDEIMGHKYCLSLTRHFEGQLLNFFYFLTWTVTICFFQNIHIYLFLLYTAITICKHFMKYQIVKNPSILTDFKKPVQMEILGLKMRASRGKRRCMIVLIQWFQKCTQRFQGICGYISLMATLKFTFFFLIKGTMFC